jgi:hypothetical protein
MDHTQFYSLGNAFLTDQGKLNNINFILEMFKKGQGK